MKQLFLTLLCGLSIFSALPAQNLNNTFRSKLTFNGQTLANVWGFTSREGKEYALLGGSLGLIIVDVTNPDAPQQIVQIPGPNSLWKEIKTYSHYAYVVSEGGSGIQVINLKKLPSPNLESHYYLGDGAIAGQLNTIHALHIDVKKGFLYAYGGNLFGGGAKVFDLKQDPYNPVYVGKFDQLGYIHDGYADNDTMYSGHIYSGTVAVVDMSNKAAPNVLATFTTPNAFTHNTWLTTDHRTILTTDEKSNSYLASFDISDLSDISLIDKIQSNPGSNSIPHNTHVLRNWAVTSWYKDGFTIVDVTRPDNIIQVGSYDTYPGTGSGFEGCWGVYPFFASGNIIATNINAQNTNNGEMFVITPSYHRACYLEGTVLDGLSGAPINNAKIEVQGLNPVFQEFSNGFGGFKTGITQSGYFKVRISKNGYTSYQTLAYFAEGEVVSIDAKLYPNSNILVTGTVKRADNNQPVAGALVKLFSGQSLSSAMTNSSGIFYIYNVDPGEYDLYASHPTAGSGSLSHQTITDTSSFTILLNNLIIRDEDSLKSQPTIGAANPFMDFTILKYTSIAENSRFTLTNTAGQVVFSEELTATSGEIAIGQNLPAGMYSGRLENSGQTVQTIKLVKLK